MLVKQLHVQYGDYVIITEMAHAWNWLAGLRGWGFSQSSEQGLCETKDVAIQTQFAKYFTDILKSELIGKDVT